ncbi:MAG: hypothetical protein DCF28_06250 [Alphaproteobacteria bacterium]|nr:MAG: hypothetical protein DCF28_06250 [Alphaproteobacteria bacterium]PZO39278.1 MAG: hypothetical protein DCE92_04585 [Alphaproteobacteria bacterium]
MSDVSPEQKRRKSDTRPRIPGVPIALRERRKGTRINRVAPRTSKLQVVGLLATIFTASVGLLVIVAAILLDMPIPIEARVTVATLLGFALFILALGSVEQRLIEIRLELMMLNGGARRSDRREDER